MADDTKVAEVPENLKVSNEDFEKMGGDTFGGTSDILVIPVDSVAGPLTYIGHRLTDLGNGKQPADIHEAKDKNDETYRLPIATNFRRQAEGADLKRGDTFYVKRFADVKKQNGVGKGLVMQMYQIKVTNRAPVAAPAPAA